MEAVLQLRALIPQIDPSQLTAEDRLALLDLFERAHQHRGGVLLNARRRSLNGPAT